MKKYILFLLAKVLNANIEEWDLTEYNRGSGTFILETLYYKIEFGKFYKLATMEHNQTIEYGFTVHFGGRQFNTITIDSRSKVFARFNVLYNDIAAAVEDKIAKREREFVALLEREKVLPLDPDLVLYMERINAKPR